MEKKNHIRAVLLASVGIAMLGAAVYLNSLRGEFVWDDRDFIVDNNYIKDWSKIAGIFTKHIGSRAAVESDAYRPLQEFTYAIDYSLWGQRVAGYHITNTALHILVALCVFWFIAVLYGDILLSFLAAVLFVAFPVHTEAVSYISGRADMLSALGILLCLIFYLKELRAHTLYAYLGMAAAYTLALLSKENALMAPLLLLLYHCAFKKKIKISIFLSLVGIACVYIAVRISSLSHLYQGNDFLLRRIPGFFVALTHYARILFFPLDLHMEYGNRLFSMGTSRALIGAAALFMLLIYAFRRKNKDSLFFFCVYWFFIALMPTTGIYPANAFYMAEHWLYLPSLGFFLLAARAFTLWYRSGKARAGAVCLVIGVVAWYSFLTVRQNRYWREPIAFYKRTLGYTPRSARVHYNLGIEYSLRKDYSSAIDAYKKSIAIEPTMALAYYNLGTVYLEIQKYQLAIDEFKRSLAIRPKYAEAYNNMCNAYISAGKSEEAVTCCRKAITLAPTMAAAHYNLGNAYYNLGEKQQALQAAKRAIEFNKGFVEAYNNLASLYSEMGSIDEAIVLWSKAVELDPGFAIAHFNLAAFYFQKKAYDLAIAHCDKVLELGHTVDPLFLEQLRPFRK